MEHSEARDGMGDSGRTPVLGDRARARHGSPRIIGVVVAIRGIWIEVLWPNGETTQRLETELEVVNGNA